MCRRKEVKVTDMEMEAAVSCRHREVVLMEKVEVESCRNKVEEENA